MKIRKTAEQKNFMVNTWMYSEDSIKCYLEQGIFFKIDDNDVPRIPTSYCKEVKVIFENGHYDTVVITIDNEMFYINI